MAYLDDPFGIAYMDSISNNKPDYRADPPDNAHVDKKEINDDVSASYSYSEDASYSVGDWKSLRSLGTILTTPRIYIN